MTRRLWKMRKIPSHSHCSGKLAELEGLSPTLPSDRAVAGNLKQATGQNNLAAV